MSDITICMMLHENCEKLCMEYCKFPEQYLGQYKDPDEAQEKMMAEKCEDCPIGKII